MPLAVTQNQSGLKKPLWSLGPDTIVSYARWTPSGSATQTLTEVQGIDSITRSGAGAYTVNLRVASKDVRVMLAYVENDTTHYHWLDVTAKSASAKTINIRHRSSTFANVLTGPSASDTVDEIQVLVFQRLDFGAQSLNDKTRLMANGPEIQFAYVHWNPTGSSTIQPLGESQGVKSVTRQGAGDYTINLATSCKALLAFPIIVDPTPYKFFEVTGTNAAAGTVTVRTRAVAAASVASGPTLADTLLEAQMVILQRMGV